VEDVGRKARPTPQGASWSGVGGSGFTPDRDSRTVTAAEITLGAIYRGHFLTSELSEDDGLSGVKPVTFLWDRHGDRDRPS